MHSRIIQLSESFIGEEDYINEEVLIDNGFVNGMIDYVSSETDRENDIEWFVQYLQQFGCVEYDGEKIVFKKGFKENYFKDRFLQLKSKVAEMEFKDFFDSLKLYELMKLIKHNYGFYVYIHDYYYNLDDFVRYILKEDVEYYFGTTLDYHY